MTIKSNKDCTAPLPPSTFWNSFKMEKVLPIILCNSSPLDVTRLRGCCSEEDEGYIIFIILKKQTKIISQRFTQTCPVTTAGSSTAPHLRLLLFDLH